MSSFIEIVSTAGHKKELARPQNQCSTIRIDSLDCFNIMKINQFIKKITKKFFTPGPSSLTAVNLIGLEPCFGRNDKKYEKIENFVMSKLKIAGQQNIIRLQVQQV